MTFCHFDISPRLPYLLSAMEETLSSRELAPKSRGNRADSAADWAVLAVGALVYVITTAHPAAMPIWAPWDFSPTIYLGTAITLLWYFRGLASTPLQERPAVWRRATFLIGLAIIYIVLQTRFEYWSQHMFFLNRIQHVVMHHLGPFLIALAWPGDTILRGMPPWGRHIVASRPVAVIVNILQQPLLAALIFSGSYYFWLVPGIHFRAMIDWRLYALMNWTMVLDGVLFWALALDPRPKPPARVSYGVRAALSFFVMFPQIVLGAMVAFSQHDLYPYYDLCGRLFPSVDALSDQHIGGIVMWIPPSMMSAIGLLVVLNAARIHEDSITETDHDAAALAELSRRWTGR